MVTFKRYRNRKLYSEELHSYCTLVHIAEVVRGGSEVRVLEHAVPGEVARDVTAQVLAQTIITLIEEGRGPSAAALLGVIRGGAIPAAST